MTDDNVTDYSYEDEEGMMVLMGTTRNRTVSNASADVRDEQLAVVEIMVLAVIFIATVVGNSFVLVALWRQIHFSPKSRMYLFMMHLSMADLLVAFFSILPQMIWKITFRFRGGDFLCRAVKYMQIMVLYLSTYILVVMAIDRYRAICWAPSSLHWNSLKVARLLVAAAWAASLLLAIPQAVLFRMTDIHQAEGVVRDCWVTFNEQWQAKIYVTWFVVSAFVLPLVILAFCYGVITYRIWSYSVEEQRERDIATTSIVHVPPGTNLVRLRRNASNRITRAKLKTIKLTFTVVLCFFVCWSPFCITQLAMAYDPPRKASAAVSIFMLLACLNSCTNPWIYLAFSGTLLNHLRICLGVGLRRARSSESIGDEEPDARPYRNRPVDAAAVQCQAEAMPASAKVPSTKSDVT